MSKNTTKRHKATASDVAAQAGVSKWTVSRAFINGASISDKARERVLTAAKALGYRPNLLARSLSKKRTQTIGVVIDQLHNPHTMVLIDAVTRQLQARGYMAMLLNITPGENYRSVMSLADQLQVDGILFLGTILTEELIAVAHDLHHIPLVQVCRYSESPEIEVVNVDGIQAGKEIAGLLLDQGFKRFGYMRGPDTASRHLQRLEGFELGLAEAGQQVTTLLTAGYYVRELGYQAMEQYLNLTPPVERVEALFCENDILALGALEAMRKVGASIAVVGFDDIDEANTLGCQLTSYSQRVDRLVEEALSRLIDGRPGKSDDWRRGELRVRQSHLRR